MIKTKLKRSSTKNCWKITINLSKSLKLWKSSMSKRRLKSKQFLLKTLTLTKKLSKTILSWLLKNNQISSIDNRTNLNRPKHHSIWSFLTFLQLNTNGPVTKKINQSKNKYKTIISRIFKAYQFSLLNNSTLLSIWTDTSSHLMFKTCPVINTIHKSWIKSKTILSMPLMNNQLRALKHWSIQKMLKCTTSNQTQLNSLWYKSFHYLSLRTN